MESDEQNNILDFGGFPGRWEITHTTAETDGEYLEMRFEINSTTCYRTGRKLTSE